MPRIKVALTTVTHNLALTSTSDMSMLKPRLRQLTLTAHVAFSVGWFGAVAAYLAPAVIGLSSTDMERVRACHLAMGLIGWFVIVPLALGALLTGVVQSLTIPWGLLRHYWVIAKLGLTVLGVTILLVHMRTVSGLAGMTTDVLTAASSGQLKQQLVVHAAGGLLVLLAATVLSVFKPWGKTRFGRREAT